MNTYFGRAMFCTRFGHQVRNELLFSTDHNNHSRKSQRGLFHGKTHRTVLKTCFSEKKHRQMLKPNVNKKKYYSDILQQFVTLPVSTKAMKCILKSGCFDNYILFTKKDKMNSKMGEFLRKIMQDKLKDPEFKVPYIPFQAKLPKRQRKRPKYLGKIMCLTCFRKYAFDLHPSPCEENSRHD
jgi:ribosomal protein L28